MCSASKFLSDLHLQAQNISMRPAEYYFLMNHFHIKLELRKVSGIGSTWKAPCSLTNEAECKREHLHLIDKSPWSSNYPNCSIPAYEEHSGRYLHVFRGGGQNLMKAKVYVMKN